MFLLLSSSLLLLTASPDTARLRQHLPEVNVHAQPRLLTLSPPGETRGLRTAFGRELTPGRAVAVWHGPPDTARVYVVRAVRLRLGARMPETVQDLPKHRRNLPEGRLQLWLSPGTLTAGPETARNLLTQPLLLTAETAVEKKGWLRFDVSSQRLLLPRAGVFVVAAGLPTIPEETFVRHRILAATYDGKTPPQDLDFRKIQPGTSTRSYGYEELRRPDGSTRLVATTTFPTLAYRLVNTAADCHSWLLVGRRGQPPSWQSVPQDLAPMRRALPRESVSDYNYELELEVEEL
ncbi:hypothetical protein [Hymenobacter swuensis]|uniref:Uncharacterized protein n=1 Tax=Hymenobacter swuensis DY53 TaxID=1227739 RepID=W8F0X4_9BACT|nr:hypothetical protein [Hymenobacter swuensis]AHJ96241.1 hypothetical protein Hsw_0646 [Hymenobacter swuensis DY53]